MPQPNQYLPLPPLEEIAPHIFKYWKIRLTDREIVDLLRKKHIDLTRYGLSERSFHTIRERLGLKRARQQAHTPETIAEAMVELRRKYPRAGARDMTSILFHEKGMAVPCAVVVLYFRIYEPGLIRERKAGRLKRRQFWAAGVNDILAVDQHDKWLRFGLALHTGIDPFSGRIHWLKVWWTNKNPKLILYYYLDFVRKNGYIPLVTQSDLGSENYGIAKAQTALHHLHDPRLVGTIQHQWMRHKKNVKPEITWSQVRHRFTPGFETLLEEGIVNGWYDMNRPLDVLVFRWVFIPWLSVELNSWREQVNNSRKRADRNKILPHGVPNLIHSSPEQFGCLDFKITVNPTAIDEVEKLYASPTDSVFELVPMEFSQKASELFDRLGLPPVTFDTAWMVYQNLVHQFECIEGLDDLLDACDANLQLLNEEDYEIDQPAGEELAGGMDFADKNGNYYMGGVNNGHGLASQQIEALNRIEEADEDFEVLGVFFSDDEEIDPNEQDDW